MQARYRESKLLIKKFPGMRKLIDESFFQFDEFFPGHLAKKAPLSVFQYNPKPGAPTLRLRVEATGLNLFVRCEGFDGRLNLRLVDFKPRRLLTLAVVVLGMALTLTATITAFLNSVQKGGVCISRTDLHVPQIGCRYSNLEWKFAKTMTLRTSGQSDPMKAARSRRIAVPERHQRNIYLGSIQNGMVLRANQPWQNSARHVQNGPRLQ